MCGLAGFVRWRRSKDELSAIAAAMGESLLHRGPDDAGIWVDESQGLGLSFRRLSIIDLSPAGHQPMVSHDGAMVMVFNGEIYNAPEIRDQLGDVSWHGHSDTEILLEALLRWGTEKTLAHLDGMFAFALWERATGKLTLARDRFGEKPLYWGWCNGAFVFGSELKALCQHPAFDGTLDPNAIAQYLRWNWFPAPSTPFAAIRSLMPGQVLELQATGTEKLWTYWDARQVATHVSPFTGTFEEATEAVDRALTMSVSRRLRADVPVALFLSGGVDSSLIAALAAPTKSDLKSYSIAFDDAYLDESPYAAAVARYFSLDLHQLRVTDADALSMVPRLSTLLDIPLGDSAAIPLALLSQLASSSVRVALSGDGADELFGGYKTHQSVAHDWDSLSGIPGRQVWGEILGSIPPGPLDALAENFGLMSGRKRRSLPGHRLAKLSQMLKAVSPAAISGIHRGLWRGLPPKVTGARTIIPNAWTAPFTLSDASSEAMLADVQTYLPDDLCVKTDRATMAASLEARLPFLNRELAELAWSLPLSYKIAPDQNKAVLRALLSRNLPADLVHRPKHGLEVPSGHWLRGALKDWAGDLLSPTRLKSQGLIDPVPVTQAWNMHQSGAKGWGNELWGMVMLQAWLDAKP